MPTLAAREQGVGVQEEISSTGQTLIFCLLRIGEEEEDSAGQVMCTRIIREIHMDQATLLDSMGQRNLRAHLTLAVNT